MNYGGKTEIAQKFFKVVQNKMHWTAHGSTAAEVVYERVNVGKPHLEYDKFRKVVDFQPSQIDNDLVAALKRLPRSNKSN